MAKALHVSFITMIFFFLFFFFGSLRSGLDPRDALTPTCLEIEIKALEFSVSKTLNVLHAVAAGNPIMFV